MEKMNSEMKCQPLNTSGETVLYQPDSNIRLEVAIDKDTVWLTQAQMTVLFGTTRNNITMHIGNVFKEHELDEKAVCKESLHTAADGKKYRSKLYNLDVIISVGYRIKSVAGTRFRQWATAVLREYTLRSYAFNSRLCEMEKRLDYKLMLQDDRLYHCGSSLKDMGRKICAITLMGYKPDDLLRRLME